MTANPAVEQFHLFEDNAERAKLQAARAEFMRCFRADNTTKSYEQTWKVFGQWCQASSRSSLPASTETLLDWITWRLSEGKKLATVKVDLAGIRFFHLQNGYKNPLRAEEVQNLIQNAARKLRQRPRGKKALSPDHLRQICELLSGDPSVRAQRDWAMLLLTFAAGWRRSEIVSLTTDDIWFDGDELWLQLGGSKTDQEGRYGREVRIPPGSQDATCPVRAIQAWFAIRGSWQGPLFCQFNCQHEILHKRLTGDTLNLRLKDALSRIGEKSTRFSAHSLRSGMITAAAANGADVLAIMQRSGHRTVSTVARYVRPVKALQLNPLAGVL